MSELLVRVIDKINPTSPYLDAQCSKRGDVIQVKPDGSPWGRDEIAGQYRVVSAPDLPIEEAAALLGPEYDTDPRNPSRTLQRRAFKLAIDDRFDGPSPVVVSADEIRAMKTRKDPIPDPAVL